ncbi:MULTISPECIES: STAS domain-containing protein [unclassified Streptomyces]|uniref:STAS domain-containing protein n=1 Tax=unclassified Streptomyces TaxID=2593676 RepID=UPI001BED0E0E|nr:MULTISPECIES: STAS domain-containing protein [unclassified Streptomyces]MBT2408503.1 STAS domain-containing protein [Streptomyces sp. ISL-21]MBT2611940.1 STAS domain-containing protein [Streptomyces sp. ISL-87]
MDTRGISPSSRAVTASPTPSAPATTDHATVTTTHLDDRITVAVTGEIDIATAPLLANALHAALAGNTPRVEADFSAVSFCDCSGLSVLLGIRHQADSQGRAFHVAGVTSRQVQRLFQATGTTTLTTPPLA